MAKLSGAGLRKTTLLRGSALTALRLYFGVACRVSPERTARWATRRFLTTHIRPPSPPEQRWLDAAEPLALEIEGRPLAAWSRGHGPLVLLVHGWEARGAQLHRFADALVEAGYRVVTWDAPGHGQTGGERSSLKEIAQAIVAASGVAPVHAVLAHSAGAVATVYALARLLLTARRLIFVAPGPDLDDYAQLFRRLLGFTPEVLALLRRNIEAGYNVCWQDFQPSRLAPSMSVPLTVFHDRDDKEVSLTEARRLVESWAGAELITTSGLGHRRILDNPWVVSQAVQRIRGNGRGPIPGGASP